MTLLVTDKFQKVTSNIYYVCCLVTGKGKPGNFSEFAYTCTLI